MAPESSEMHGVPCIFVVLEVGGRGAPGLRIMRNALDGYHFHVFGSGREGKRLGLSEFSCFWKWGGRVQVASES